MTGVGERAGPPAATRFGRWDDVYQIKVELAGAEPPIWRRLLVDAVVRLPRLHDILQATIGWTNSHLHEFLVGEIRFGEPDAEFDTPPIDYTAIELIQIAPRVGSAIQYLYDFGDHWEHLIVVEEALPRESISDALPMCVDGERACPPEDVGGTHGYTQFLIALSNPYHPEHKQWAGGLAATSTRPASTCIASTGAWPVTANAVPIVLHRPRAGPRTDRGAPSNFVLGHPSAAREDVQDIEAWGAVTSPGTEPSADEWSRFVADLEELLTPLGEARWDLPESYNSEFDGDRGPMLFGSLTRTCMVIEVEYEPRAGGLRLLPYVDVTGEWPPAFSMLDDELAIPVASTQSGVEALSSRAGELGLLDATRIQAHDMTTIMSLVYTNWVFDPARRYRRISPEALANELEADEAFSQYFKAVVTWFGASVLPDLVPSAVPLGIACWCWRNNTAVEEWHLADDVLMARTNIAVTRAIERRRDRVRLGGRGGDIDRRGYRPAGWSDHRGPVRQGMVRC